MTIQILMPALSPTMSEGTLAKWLKKEGDKIESGDVIAEIETDKATMEVESADEGVLGRILVEGGTDNVPVNSVIGILLEDGEGDKDLEAALKETEKTPAAEKEEKSAEKRDATPKKADTKKADKEDTDRLFASPVARRMAEDSNLDLSLLKGTGPKGRIVKADIEEALKHSGADEEPLPVQAVVPVRGTAAEFVEVPHTNMRKVIATRLTESKQEVPHFYLTLDCELDALLKLREDLNEKAELLGQDTKLSVNDFIIRAAALALKKVPAVNVSWGEKALKMYSDVDVSVAVSTPGGLVTPVIRNADRRRLPDVSRSMKALAAKARNGKLTPEEYQGGTFTISNLGMFGIKQFNAIVNPPQACILAVGAVEQRLVVKDGAIAVASMMTCTLSVDHRAVDGAMGARFMSVFKKLLEDPLTMVL